MSSISVLLLSVHDTVHDSRMKLNYSEPKIFAGGVDQSQWSKLTKTQQKEALKKDWYVYFSFRDPNTGKLKRQPNIKGGANRFRNKRDRYSFLKTLQQNLLFLLRAGFNPYEDNSELEKEFFGIKDESSEAGSQLVKEPVQKQPEEKNVPPEKTEPENESISIAEAFELGLQIKKKTLNENSYTKYKSRIGRFQIWLEKNGNTHIDSVDKKTVIRYLNSILKRTSARNRNNTRTTLSSLYTTLENNEIVKENFILKIDVLKAIPERNKTFTPKQIKELNDYLDKHDPLLKLFTQFISFNFLRPIEVCRLRVKDIDVLDRKLYVRAKNKPVKVKIIPQILLKFLPDMTNMDENHYLFTPTHYGGVWDTAETDKRNYFSKRFKKVKDHFGLGKDYGLYSFRHTFITKVYREMAKNATPLEVKSKLMVITGHTTQVALEKYLRDIDAVLPEDYSHLLTNEL